MIRKLCDMASCRKEISRVPMEQLIIFTMQKGILFTMYLYAKGYAFGVRFYATEYRVLRGFQHTPVTSLVRYLPPRLMPFRPLFPCVL